MIPKHTGRKFINPITNQVLNGLLPVQRRICYPGYDFKQAHIKTTDTISLAYPIHSFRPARRSKNGLYHGKAVDKQITMTVDLFRKHQLPKEFFTNPLIRKPYTKEIKNKCRRLHIDTVTWWKIMIKLNWTPIQTQVPVAHQRVPIATAVDVVAKDVNGKIIIIENKTGQTNYLFHHTGLYMKSPLKKLTDCVHHQHILQLLGTKKMYERTYPNQEIKRAVIIYVNKSGAHISDLPSWTNDFDYLLHLEKNL